LSCVSPCRQSSVQDEESGMSVETTLFVVLVIVIVLIVFGGLRR